MGSVLIAEERHSGHLLQYVRILVERALHYGEHVHVALSAATLTTPEYQLHLSELASRISIHVLTAPLTPSRLLKLADTIGADHIVVPHGDELAVRFARGPRVAKGRVVTLLIMRDPRWELPTTPSRTIRGLAKLSFTALSRLGSRVRIVWLREPLHVAAKGESFAVDPFISYASEEQITAESALLRDTWPTAAHWFVITGGITPWKNLPLVLEAFARMDEEKRARCGLAVIGPIRHDSGVSSGSLRESAEAMGLTCVVDDRLLTNDEINVVVAAADTVIMAYSTHSPNSTLGKAYVLGTSIVAAGSRSIHRFVRNVGFDLVSPLEVNAIAENLTLAMDRAAPPRHPGALSAIEFADQLLDRSCRRR